MPLVLWLCQMAPTIGCNHIFHTTLCRRGWRNWTKESGLAGHLTFDELMNKLDTIDRLMTIDGWTAQANADYKNLFNVDKDLGATTIWSPEDRLEMFTWDEACVYALPEGYHQDLNQTDNMTFFGKGNNCTLLLAQISLGMDTNVIHDIAEEEGEGREKEVFGVQYRSGLSEICYSWSTKLPKASFTRFHNGQGQAEGTI